MMIPMTCDACTVDPVPPAILVMRDLEALSASVMFAFVVPPVALATGLQSALVVASALPNNTVADDEVDRLMAAVRTGKKTRLTAK